MKIDFGLVLPPGLGEGLSKAWLDDLGDYLPQLTNHFRSIWKTDHFFWDGDPTDEAWTTLAYIAGRWSWIDVGSIVLCQGYRNPALLAKMAATLQNLSGGRLILGLGAGWKKDEHVAYGYPYPSGSTRVEQLAETLEIIRRMWTQSDTVSYQGKHHIITEAYCEPKPDPVPPILVGANSPKSLRVAARYADWWNQSEVDPVTYSKRMKMLWEHCDSIGRDPASLRLTWFGGMAMGRTEAEAQRRGAAIKGGSKDAFPLVGTPEQIVNWMGEFINLGVDYFMLEVVDLLNPDVRGMLLEAVLPKVCS